MQCLSLLRADPGNEEASHLSLTSMFMSRIHQKPLSYVKLAPNPIPGRKQNGKSAQESKRHALEREGDVLPSRNHYWLSHGTSIAVGVEAHSHPGQTALPGPQLWTHQEAVPFASSTGHAGYCECLTHHLVLLLPHPAALVVCSFLSACCVPNKPSHSKASKSLALLVISHSSDVPQQPQTRNSGK